MELKEEIFTDNLICFLAGFLICYILTKKPLEIKIHHKNETIIQPVPESAMPKMSEIDKNPDVEEDKAYKEMGEILTNVQEIFGGSDRDE